MEKIQMPTDQWKDKQNVVNLWNGILFSHENG